MKLTCPSFKSSAALFFDVSRDLKSNKNKIYKTFKTPYSYGLESLQKHATMIQKNQQFMLKNLLTLSS